MHPLIDTCDVILSSAEDIYPGNWNYLFLPRMVAEVLGDKGARERLEESIQTAPDDKIRDQRLALAGTDIWRRLCDVARQPPKEPRKICEMIVRDRQRTDEWHRREEGRRSRAMNDTTTKEKPAKAATERKVAGFAPTAKITLLKDKDGKVYGKDNNPKRANSSGATAFAKYQNGMTVQQAVDAGIPSANLRWDLDHNYISIA